MRILVTDTQELAGLGAVRSLGRAGHTVTATYPEGYLCPATASRYCTGGRAYPDPWQEHAAFKQWLLQMMQNGEFDAVFPVAEAVLFALSALRSQIPSTVWAFLPPDASLHFTLSKYRSTFMAKEAGLQIPPTVFVYDGEGGAWHDDLSSLTFPIVMKTDNALLPNGAYRKGKVFFAFDPHAAQDILGECREIGSSVIAQSFVPGAGAGVALLRAGNEVLLTLGYRRIREVPWSGGPSSLRTTCHDAVLEEHALRFFQAIGFQGLGMAEFRQEHPGAIPHFLETNGRLWGSVALALHAGVDFPAALVDYETTGNVAPKRRKKNYPILLCRNVYPGDFRHVFSVLKSHARPGLPVPPSKLKTCLRFFLSFLHPCIRYDVLWWSDPMPAFTQARIMFGDLKGGLLFNLHSLLKRFGNRRILARAHREHHRKLSSGKPYFAAKPRTMLFLCYGNVYRSPFAEEVWKARYPNLTCASSAGFYPKSGRMLPFNFRPLLCEFGIDLNAHRSKIVSQEMIDNADLVLVMDIQNFRSLLRMFPGAASKTFFLGAFSGEENYEIADPYKMDSSGARKSFEKIVHSLKGLAEAL